MSYRPRPFVAALLLTLIAGLAAPAQGAGQASLVERSRQFLSGAVARVKQRAAALASGIDDACTRGALKLTFGQMRPRGTLFRGRPTASQVAQASLLGTCWIVASEAAVANARPDLLQQMLRQNRDGSVTVELHDGGAAVEERVTSLPRNPLIRSHAKRGGLWVPGLEKAIAQRSGGYDRVAFGGWPDRALALLTGMPTARVAVTPAGKEAVWQTLQGNVTRRLPTVASTGSDRWTSGLGVLTGLAANHAFAVLDVRQDYHVR